MFIKNLTQVQENFFFNEMIEFHIRNKRIYNLSNSNVKALLSINLKSLSLIDCKLQSIDKGIFNSMLQLNNLSLAKNQIDSFENDSFVTEPY